MKNYLMIVFYFCILSCGDSKTGITIKRDEVLIADKGISFQGIVPLINQKELKQTGSDLEGANTIIHYKDPVGGKNIDLIFKTISNDSLHFYQISARFSNKTEWLSTDTTKLRLERLFSGSGTGSLRQVSATD